MLAAWAEWDGVALLKVLAYALEDANFHSESAIVEEMIEIIERDETAAEYQLVKRPAKSIAGLPGILFTTRDNLSKSLGIVEQRLNEARRNIKAKEAEIASALNEQYNLKGGDGLHGTLAFRQWVADNRDDLPGDWNGVFLFVDRADSPTTVALRWDIGRKLPVDAVPLDIVLDMRRAYLQRRAAMNAKLLEDDDEPIIVKVSGQTDEIPAAPADESAPPSSE